MNSIKGKIFNFTSDPTPWICSLIGGYGPGLVLDALTVDHHVTLIKKECISLKKRITRFINVNNIQIPIKERKKKYKHFQSIMDRYCTSLLRDHQSRRYSIPLNVSRETRNHIRSLTAYSKWKIIECDKNMGLEAALKSDVKANSYRILEQPHFESTSMTQQQTKEHVVLQTLRVFNTITRKHPAFMLEEQRGYKSAYFGLMNQRNGKSKYDDIPNLSCLHKIHKKKFDWRAILRLHRHPSNFLQKTYNKYMQAALAVFENISGYDAALENSHHLIRKIEISCNFSDTHHVVIRAADLKSMYDRLTKEDVIKGIHWISKFVNLQNSITECLLLILDLVYENIFVCAYNKLVRLKAVTAMGWIISPINAIVALLRVEYESRNEWIPNMLCNEFTESQINSIDIAVDARYIDDTIHIFGLEKDKWNTTDLEKFKNILRNDKGSRYFQEFGKRMELKCEIDIDVVFLDINIHLNPINNKIHFSQHIKPGKINMLLHPASNSHSGHFQGLFSSGLYSNIMLNSNYEDYIRNKLHFIQRLKDRGYHEGFIRFLSKKCGMKWELKSKYKESLKERYDSKKMNLIQEYRHIFYKLDDDIISSIHIAEQEEDDEEVIIYFKRIWNRHCSRNDRLRVIMSEFITDLGIDGIKIDLCNKVDKKLGALL